MLVLYGMYNSIQFGSVEDKSTTYIYIHMNLDIHPTTDARRNCENILHYPRK